MNPSTSFLPVSLPPRLGRTRCAFTLLEVMIAVALFFLVSFTVLALVSQSLRQARSLQSTRSPLTSLAAQTSITNQLEEGFDSGDFGDVFPDYDWSREVVEFETNGLYEVHLAVIRRGQGKPEADMTILLYRPNVGGPRRPGARR